MPKFMLTLVIAALATSACGGEETRLVPNARKEKSCPVGTKPEMIDEAEDIMVCLREKEVVRTETQVEYRDRVVQVPVSPAQFVIAPHWIFNVFEGPFVNDIVDNTSPVAMAYLKAINGSLKIKKVTVQLPAGDGAGPELWFGERLISTNYERDENKNYTFRFDPAHELEKDGVIVLRVKVRFDQVEAIHARINLSTMIEAMDVVGNKVKAVWEGDGQPFSEIHEWPLFAILPSLLSIIPEEPIQRGIPDEAETVATFRIHSISNGPEAVLKQLYLRQTSYDWECRNATGCRVALYYDNFGTGQWYEVLWSQTVPPGRITMGCTINLSGPGQTVMRLLPGPSNRFVIKANTTSASPGGRFLVIANRLVWNSDGNTNLSLADELDPPITVGQRTYAN